jgi:surface antigen
MSFRENQRISSDGLQIPGLVQSEDSIEQLSFGANPVTPTNWQAGPQSASGLTDAATAHQPISQAEVADLPTTHQPVSQPGLKPISQAGLVPLTDSQPGTTRSLAEAVAQSVGAKALANTTAQRPPLVIQGTNKAAGRLVRPPQGRRHVINIAALVLLFVIIGGTLLVVSPLGNEVGLRSLVTGSSLVQNTNNLSLSLVAQATATAVHYQQTDGYDPGSDGVYVTGSPHAWPYGVCTYWANYRYHQITGNWVTWTGNAYQWAEGAKLAGWNVSSTPHAPSIIVLAPGVQGASGYGHVAVVESVNGNSAYTSNMNWYANGGGYGIKSYYTFTAGYGVTFIWK